MMAECPRYLSRQLRCALALGLASVGLAAGRAVASDAAALVVLEWAAPEGCPDGAYVEREVHRLLGDASAGSPYMQARAQVRQEKSGRWHIELRTMGRQGPGVRTVTAESCPALADAAALILALAIDPQRVAANRSTTTAAPSATAQPVPDAASASTGVPSPSASPQTPTHPEQDVPRSTSPPPVRFAVAASAVLDTGTLPAVAAGLAARLAATPATLSSLRLELGAGIFADDATTSPRTRSGTFSLRTFDAGGCMVTPVGRLELGACANVELAWLSAAGLYESAVSRGEAEWAVLRVRATAAYAFFPAWAIRADLGGGFDVTQPEFVSAGAEQGLIHRPARYTARGALGLELRF